MKAGLPGAASAADAGAQAMLAADYLAGRSVPPGPQTAADRFKRAASGGDAEAMAELAKLELAGDLPSLQWPAMFPPSSAQPRQPCFGRARSWAQRAASAGSAEGRAVLAVLLAQGNPEWQDDAASRALLEQAAAEGSATARFALAIQHAQHRTADAATIAGLLHAAAQAGVAAAAYLFGVAAETATGCERDAIQAVALYRQAAEQGFVWAQARLGHALIGGIGTELDPFRGETWLRMAARAGNGAAAALLGNFYARPSDATNYLEAGHWFLRAAELGDAPSARIASFMHLTATGLPGDRRDAALCLQRAEALASSMAAADPDPAQFLVGNRADLCAGIDVRAWFAPLAGAGDPLAAYRLGVCFAMGIGGRRDDARAAEWLGRAAATIPSAQLLYGQILLDGTKARDPAEGRACIQRAAAAGLPDARTAWAELLANGRGGERDTQAALCLFTEAAQRGHRGAMYAVGALHGGGHGLPPSYPIAAKWFRKAAEAGHGQAQLMLGRYLAAGLAGSPDRAAAATWLRRAVWNGIGQASKDLAALGEIG